MAGPFIIAPSGKQTKCPSMGERGAETGICVASLHGLECRNNKKWTFDPCNDLDEFQSYYARGVWGEAATKGYIPHDCLNMTFLKRQNY